jgi:hypothetical protein
MKHRYVVLTFSLLLAALVAVPAVGQSTDPTATGAASAKKIAKKAKKKAKKALKKAKQAQSSADAAQASADSAQSSANTAQATADSAQSSANAAQATADSKLRGYFATVDYDNATPSVTSGSPGVTGAGEGALGFPKLTFPESMTDCAITGIASAAAGTQIFRRSNGATTVQFKIATDAGAPVRSDFNIIAVC